MRLAWGAVSKKCATRADSKETHVFDVRARMDGDDVAVLDAEIVADNAVQAGAAIIKIIVGQNDEDRVLSLLASDEDCVAAEQLERLHGVVGEGDDRVVIIDGIGDPGFSELAGKPRAEVRGESKTYISWLGFFFFFRMAVDVPSSCSSC